MNLFSDYDFAFGGELSQQTGGRRYKSGPGAKKAIPKKPRLKLRVVDGKLKYVPKKLRKRSGRNIFISEYADKHNVSGPTLFKEANKAWNALSKAKKDKYEDKADAMGYKPAAKTRAVAERFQRKSPGRAGKKKSPRKKSPRKKSPRKKSPKRKTPKRKTPKRRKQKGGSSCGSGEDYGYNADDLGDFMF